jgi:hypothetical protein
MHEGEQRCDGGLDVGDQGHLDRIADAHVLRLQVDLNRPSLAGFRIRIDPGHGGTQDQKRVAGMHDVIGRFGAEMPDAAGGVGRIIGEHAFAKQRFRNRSVQFRRQLSNFVARAEGPLAHQDGNLVSLIDEGCGLS